MMTESTTNVTIDNTQKNDNSTAHDNGNDQRPEIDDNDDDEDCGGDCEEEDDGQYLTLI